MGFAGVGERVHNLRPLQTILAGGLLAGVLDIFDAIVVTIVRGGTPTRMFQYIASGLIGPSSFQGGWPTAALGLLCHFVIATTWAAVYFFAARRITWMLRRPVFSGLVFGLLVYGFMNYVVLPLSGVPKPIRTPPIPLLINGVLAICLLVGLPIALITARAFRRS